MCCRSAGAGHVPDGRYFLGGTRDLRSRSGLRGTDSGEDPRVALAHMTVHGVLHLRGFDHERRPEAAKMAAKEIQILDRLAFRTVSLIEYP